MVPARKELRTTSSLRLFCGASLHTPVAPVQAPRANTFAERWVGTIRRELLDRLLIVGPRQLDRVLAVYVAHSNQHRPHRALGQQPPLASAIPPAPSTVPQVVHRDRLGGLIHEYAQVA
jgi:putative transposase